MQVRVLAFAALRDRLGFAEKTVDFPVGATVADAAAQILGEAPPRGLAYAVNQEYADASKTLSDGDELALLPPVAGGTDDDLLRLQPEPIDVAALIAAVNHPSCGALLTFLGTAREIPGEVLETLEYEAYAPMAQRFFVQLADETRRKFEIGRIAIVHRTGSLAIGEVSVAIVLSSPHRASGFDALRHVIERIKEEAPIWKKEVTLKRSHWVESEKLDTP